MNQSSIKLTIRIPATLHKSLRRRAEQENLSLNKLVIDTLQLGLEQPPALLNQRERVLLALRNAGLLTSETPPAQSAPHFSYAEWRQHLKGVTLSDAVFEERETQP
ncbi:MAG: hypothetical protein Fur0016_19310 [Anaerolineales bacterium]